MSRCNFVVNISPRPLSTCRGNAGPLGDTLAGTTRLHLVPKRSSPLDQGSSAIERLATETQDAMVAFLEVDLDLSDTILKTAELAISDAYGWAALERVRQAIGMIRRLG